MMTTEFLSEVLHCQLCDLKGTVYTETVSETYLSDHNVPGLVLGEFHQSSHILFWWYMTEASGCSSLHGPDTKIRQIGAAILV